MSVERRSMWQSLFVYFGRSIEVFFAFIFFYLTIVFYGAIFTTGSIGESGEITIYVQSNGVHTDVVLPTVTDQIDWRNFIDISAYPSDSPQDYVAIGWGDKGFFLETPTWAELKVSTALNAAFLPSPTAMHCMYMEQPVVSDSKRAIRIDKKAYLKMIKRIKRTFSLKNGKVDLIANKGYTPYDNFYEAHDSYHCFKTCNSWTNDVLKAGGVRTGVLALFPFGIMNPLEK